MGVHGVKYFGIHSHHRVRHEVVEGGLAGWKGRLVGGSNLRESEGPTPLTDGDLPSRGSWKLAEMVDIRGLFLCTGTAESSPVEMRRFLTLAEPDVFIQAKL